MLRCFSIWEIIKKLGFLKKFFAYAAKGASPIIGKFLKRSSGGNAIIGVANCGIVFPTTRSASIFIHSLKVLFVINCFVSHCKYNSLFLYYIIISIIVSYNIITYNYTQNKALKKPHSKKRGQNTNSNNI